MTKIVAYTALRYGADYLGWAIRSAIDLVDEWHILYAKQPSHGHWSAVPCPESEAELYDIARQTAGTKLIWHAGDWSQEGQQRGAIYEFAPDADAILVVDSDEIYSPLLLQTVERNIASQPNGAPARYWRLPFIHYWRSFNRCILHDPAYPERLIFPKHAIGGVTVPLQLGVVNHMGYAIRPEIMRYKWLIHGHLPELRRDVNWYQDVYLANRQTDCHPVGSEWWNPETVNPLSYMPDCMITHPFYGKKVIE